MERMMDEYQKPGEPADDKVVQGEWKAVSSDASRKSARPNREVKKVAGTAFSARTKKTARPEHLSAGKSRPGASPARKSARPQTQKREAVSERKEKSSSSVKRDVQGAARAGGAAIAGAASKAGAGIVSGLGKAAGALSKVPGALNLKDGALKDTRYGQDGEFRRRVIMSVAGALCVLGISIVGVIAGHVGGEDVPMTVSMDAKKGEGTGSGDGSVTEAVDAVPVSDREPVSLTVSVFGDCTLGTDEYFDWDSSLCNYYDMYGADYFLENVRDIFESDDLSIANFEGTLTYSDEREDKSFAFKADPEYAQILTGSGVDCANLANNHSHDYGEQSYLDTIEALDTYGLPHFGYDDVLTLDVKGVKVGILGIYELDDHEAREQQLRDNIQKLKDAGSELIIAIFHWGEELEEAPYDSQRYLGRLAIDLGADLVCGHHPHVLQGIEIYKGRYIVYSLGNFCFGGNTYPTEFDTMIYQQTFTIDGNGVAMDRNINLIPCCVSSDWDYNNYQPTPLYDDEYEYERVLQKVRDRSAMIEGATEVWQ